MICSRTTASVWASHRGRLLGRHPLEDLRQFGRFHHQRRAEVLGRVEGFDRRVQRHDLLDFDLVPPVVGVVVDAE